MNRLNLIVKSLTFYRRTHLSVLLGTLVTTAILTGALIVGDSVQYSLKRIALLRLGNTEYAINTNDRFFRQNLATELSQELDITFAPVLKMDGIGINSTNQSRVNKIQVLGVEENFWKIGKTEDQINNPDEVAINERLATRLKINSGDEILVRIEKINFLPADVPFASKDNQSVAIRLKVGNIIDDNEFGRFNLTTSQISPFSIFIPIQKLAEEMDLSTLCNVILVENSEFELNDLDTAIFKNWHPTDAQFKIRELENSFELISDRVFIDEITVQSAINSFPKAEKMLTYFVNGIRKSDAITPYSFISAPGTSIVPSSMKDNEIIINQWLANDLNAKVGDEISVKYFNPNSEQELAEDSTQFIVHSIISNNKADATFAPNFPGLSDSENCQDWDPGIPIDLDAIRDEDEEYWDEYHASPKAFITLETAQELWGNRYGSLTSLRFSKDENSIKSTGEKILKNLSPQSFGLVYQSVLDEAMISSSEATDFGELFIGLSFFIIAAALLLTGLLFVLGIEQRKDQTAVMLSMGFLPKQIRQILLIEGSIIAILGGILGAIGGILYNKVIIYLLSTIWIDTVGTSSLVVKIDPITLIIGGLISIVLAIISMMMTIRKQTSMTVKELQTNVALTQYKSTKSANWSLVISIISFLVVAAIIFLVHPGRDISAANVFWGAGFLMLMGMIFLCNWLINHLNNLNPGFSLYSISLKNITRKRGRSLATIALLAFGVFVIIGVGANRHDALKNAEEKRSGTGSFAFWAETTIPVLQNLNSDKSLRQFGLKDADLNVNFVSMKVFEGDDASCLNLNKIHKPKILGVKSEELFGRFSFSKENIDWSVLDDIPENNTIPAISDMGTIIWSLGKSLGDTVTYTDENGQTIHLKLVGGLSGSMLQGNMLISHANFIKHFPSVSGTKAFLIDTNSDHETVINTLSRTMQDYGLEIVTTVEKLAGFQNLENTYLSIFLALGGLGLIIGTIGIGILVIRNVLERRNELALLQAVGFQQNLIMKMIIIENLIIVFAGIFVGTFSAIFAVLPSLLSPGEVIPYLFILTMVGLIAISGIFWTIFATKLSTKGNLIPALRSE